MFRAGGPPFLRNAISAHSAARPGGNMPEIRGEDPMSSDFERGKQAARDERAIRSLLDRTDAPVAQVRSLFAQEFSRLELGAKVRSYLGVLTASNVRSMLRRRTASSRRQ
jgi:hypothetical protein